MIKVRNTVISLEKEGKRNVYISVKKRPELFHSLMHKLRVKCVVYGFGIHIYDPEMDFANTLNAGWTIVEDNRSTYVHDVKIIPAYVKKKNETKDLCPLCGQKKHKKDKTN